MNTLVQEYLAQTNDVHIYGDKPRPGFNGYDSSCERHNSKFGSPRSESSPVDGSSWSSSSSYEGPISKEKDHSDAVLKFISEMLMTEEDLENQPCMLHDCLALQATEKSLYNALNTNHDQIPSINSCRSSSDHSPSSSGAKKTRNREDSDLTIEQYRSNKQFANNIRETEPLEMYDNVLLCSYPESVMQTSFGETEQSQIMESSRQKKQSKGGSNRRRPRGGDKKQGVVIKEVVDLRTLLMQCAQAVASFDIRTSDDLLLRIRQHSSRQGDGTERLAYYFANALEARLAGNGTELYSAIHSKRISAAEFLKAYKMFITACPFKKMSNLFANRTIAKLATGATTLHIIDFGILYGYQWPCLIQVLSERPGGPPTLRITGIDFPQPGFRPAERIEDTGRRLAKYCERFGVPFEYNAIAQRWDTIRVEDVRIRKDELVVVNSLYRLHNVMDETVAVNSPRDGVLDLIKKINPDMFIHGVANGTYYTPFFMTRFKEAFYHYSSMFDMFEVTIPKKDENRLLFEEHVFGKEVMNVIACEGTERIERPETYKQWQLRSLRSGFTQNSLDQEIVKCVRSKAKTDYHKDFSVDEHGKWMLQGWKGRVIHAISCWQPAHN